MIKSELLNSKQYIEHKKIELDKYIALTMYLTKSEWFIASDQGNDEKLVAIDYYIVESMKKHYF